MNVAIAPVSLYAIPLAAASGAFVLALGLDLAKLLVALVAPSSAGLVRALGAAATRKWIAAASMGAAIIALFAESVMVLKYGSLVSAGPRLARSGSLDASLGLLLDPTNAVACFAVLAGSFAVLVWGKPRSALAQAAIAAFAATVSVGVMADGFPALLAGWLGSGVLFAVLIGAKARRSAGRSLGLTLASSMAVALAAALLFWALGGKFLDGRRYLADYRARFVAVTDVPGTAPQTDLARLGTEAPGELTMLTHPGARVYLAVANETQLTPGLVPFAIAPFTNAKVPSGLQKVAIDPGGAAIVGGDGHDIALLDQVRFQPGSRVSIHVAGPTVTFSEIGEQLRAPGTDVASRKLAGVPLLDAARALLVLALLGLGLAVGAGRKSGEQALGAAGAIALAVVVCVRLDALFASAGALALIAAAVAAGIASLQAFAAVRSRDTSALLVRVPAWFVAMIALGTFAGAPGAAFAASAVALGVASAAIVLDEAADRARPASGTATSLRPAIVAMSAGAIAWTGLAVAEAFARGTVALTIVNVAAASSFVAALYAVHRSFFALEQGERAADGAAELATSTKKTKKKKSKDRPKEVDVAPSAPPLRPSAGMAAALVAALGMLSAFVAVGQAVTPQTEHRGARIVSVFAALLIGGAVFLRARQLAGERPASPRLVAAVEDERDEVAEEPGLVARLVLGIDRALRAPTLLVTSFVGRRDEEEDRS